MEIKYKAKTNNFETVEELKGKSHEDQMKILLDPFSKTGTQHPPMSFVRGSGEAVIISHEKIVRIIAKDKQTEGRHPVEEDCRREIAKMWQLLFNLALFTEKWPTAWKSEVVTVIPKISNPHHQEAPEHITAAIPKQSDGGGDD